MENSIKCEKWTLVLSWDQQTWTANRHDNEILININSLEERTFIHGCNYKENRVSLIHVTRTVWFINKQCLLTSVNALCQLTIWPSASSFIALIQTLTLFNTTIFTIIAKKRTSHYAPERIKTVTALERSNSVTRVVQLRRPTWPQCRSSRRDIPETSVRLPSSTDRSWKTGNQAMKVEPNNKGDFMKAWEGRYFFDSFFLTKNLHVYEKKEAPIPHVSINNILNEECKKY